jgi:hypothetical protein
VRRLRLHLLIAAGVLLMLALAALGVVAGARRRIRTVLA